MPQRDIPPSWLVQLGSRHGGRVSPHAPQSGRGGLAAGTEQRSGDGTMTRAHRLPPPLPHPGDTPSHRPAPDPTPCCHFACEAPLPREEVSRRVNHKGKTGFSGPHAETCKFGSTESCWQIGGLADEWQQAKGSAGCFSVERPVQGTEKPRLPFFMNSPETLPLELRLTAESGSLAAALP